MEPWYNKPLYHKIPSVIAKELLAQVWGVTLYLISWNPDIINLYHKIPSIIAKELLAQVWGVTLYLIAWNPDKINLFIIIISPQYYSKGASCTGVRCNPLPYSMEPWYNKPLYHNVPSVIAKELLAQVWGVTLHLIAWNPDIINLFIIIISPQYYSKGASCTGVRCNPLPYSMEPW